MRRRALLKLTVCVVLAAWPARPSGQAVASAPTPRVWMPLSISLWPLPPPPDVRIVYIEYDPPGSDVEGEYVRLKNYSPADVEIAGWSLQDAAGHAYRFPTFTLNAGGAVRVWTRCDLNSAEDLYWCQGAAIWNNRGDCALLFDRHGRQVDRRCYGVVPMQR